MSDSTAGNHDGETGGQVSGQVLVRYWAAARAAAGVAQDSLDVDAEVTLDQVLERARALHREQPRFADVLRVCSVLVGERPVGGRDPGAVVVRPGETVELLPPFAGGAPGTNPE